MDEQEHIDYLLSVGALYYDGVDKNGEKMFKINSEMMQLHAPELYRAMLDDLEEGLLELYEKGLINIEYNENLEALFSISDEGRALLRGAGLMDENGPIDFFRYDSI